MSPKSTSTNSIPIDQAYPGAFKPGTGINVSPSTIHGVINSYKIDPFPASEQNRNHYDSRGGAQIKYLIMHYTVDDFALSVDKFTANVDTGRTSAHFIITEESEEVKGGQLLQVVPDDMRAWHSGVSRWQQDKNLNAISLGIEHVNKGFTEGEEHAQIAQNRQYYPFDEEQIHTSGIISKAIVSQYNILPQHVLGHEDITPGRKFDPGPLFPWAKFYQSYGVGAWLDDDEMNKDVIIQKYHPIRPYPTCPDQNILLQMLIAYGYCLTSTTASDVIKAFKAHFSANQCPELYDDVIRQEEMFWAWALEAKYCAVRG
ncbi:N-acetylmuramoyl-L-alanine amidase [Candidatus Tisiphia endosymbiont of Nemotelus uliginosus]|uniref:N-acetylmuramoyl-L-alanine amidase n=1 Tax=Candidatus Tisiphia endosymbiont of Nemotelus uliginosus TaxID=3077926 RepID=UPI0035C8C7C5